MIVKIRYYQKDLQFERITAIVGQSCGYLLIQINRKPNLQEMSPYECAD